MEILEGIRKKFDKIAKRDKPKYSKILALINRILDNPQRLKPLRAPLAGYRRAHVDSFVLIYRIDETRKTVVITDYCHHDEAYKTQLE